MCGGLCALRFSFDSRLSGENVPVGLFPGNQILFGAGASGNERGGSGPDGAADGNRVGRPVYPAKAPGIYAASGEEFEGKLQGRIPYSYGGQRGDGGGAEIPGKGL